MISPSCCCVRPCCQSIELLDGHLGPAHVDDKLQPPRHQLNETQEIDELIDDARNRVFKPPFARFSGQNATGVPDNVTDTSSTLSSALWAGQLLWSFTTWRAAPTKFSSCPLASYPGLFNNLASCSNQVQLSAGQLLWSVQQPGELHQPSSAPGLASFLVFYMNLQLQFSTLGWPVLLGF
jgi:hypothetical protein